MKSIHSFNTTIINAVVQLRQLLRDLLPSLLAICGFFLLCGVVLYCSGRNPLDFYTTIYMSGFSSFDEFGGVLFYATPLIFIGLAVAIGFNGGMLNIGCEGQLNVAAFAAALVGIHIQLPFMLLVPFCIVAALVAGGIWGAIPGLLKAKFGAHEVINTIMMNFIAAILTNFLITSIFQEPGQMNLQTSPIQNTGQLPRISGVLTFLPDDNLLNVSFLLACTCVIIVYIFLKWTRWGYELRLVGKAPEVAEYGGINPRVVIVWVMLLSGAIAGLAGVADVMGYNYRYVYSFSSGWGFTGIAVALLGKNHPFGVFAAALLFGLLDKVALDIEFLLGIPRGLFLIGQGLLIITLVCLERLSKKV